MGNPIAIWEPWTVESLMTDLCLDVVFFFFPIGGMKNGGLIGFNQQTWWFSRDFFMWEMIVYFIELDYGKIYTGKPDQFDGKNPWVSGEDFPNKTNPVTIGMMYNDRQW